MSLDSFLQFKINKDGLKPRKLDTLPRFALIYGAISSGKKSLAFYNLDEFTYINMSDLRFINADFKSFIEKNKIKNLIINEPFLEFELGNLERCYILSSNKNYSYKDFIKIRLNFLDYEEFISFSKKNYSPSEHLSNYLLLGQNPANVDLDPLNAALNTQAILKQHLSENEIITLKELALKIGVQTSILSLFSEFLKHKKIAKNDFFKCVYSLEDRFLLHWVKHIKKNLKKPYFYDFSIKNSLSFKKDFSKTYENLIANELLMVYDEIFYDDDINFIISSASLGILCEAFTNKDFIKLKSKKLSKKAKELELKNILVLSLNEQFNFVNDEIRFIGLTLNTWLISKELNDWD
ncbi:ATP-binding protein [Campylobacter sp. RM12654]|uniref:hypothetical protein n=1 Tax=Campylobacter sp. RM12654 TaxID=2735738 RepID=UPI0030143B5B|nr:ATP-binding protein [Campylobacter sp. RM12654]